MIFFSRDILLYCLFLFCKQPSVPKSKVYFTANIFFRTIFYGGTIFFHGPENFFKRNPILFRKAPFERLFYTVSFVFIGDYDYYRELLFTVIIYLRRPYF